MAIVPKLRLIYDLFFTRSKQNIPVFGWKSKAFDTLTAYLWLL